MSTIPLCWRNYIIFSFDCNLYWFPNLICPFAFSFRSFRPRCLSLSNTWMSLSCAWIFRSENKRIEIKYICKRICNNSSIQSVRFSNQALILIASTCLFIPLKISIRDPPTPSRISCSLAANFFTVHLFRASSFNRHLFDSSYWLWFVLFILLSSLCFAYCWLHFRANIISCLSLTCKHYLISGLYNQGLLQFSYLFFWVLKSFASGWNCILKITQCLFKLSWYILCHI